MSVFIVDQGTLYSDSAYGLGAIGVANGRANEIHDSTAPGAHSTSTAHGHDHDDRKKPTKVILDPKKNQGAFVPSSGSTGFDSGFGDPASLGDWQDQAYPPSGPAIPAVHPNATGVSQGECHKILYFTFCPNPIVTRIHHDGL